MPPRGFDETVLPHLDAAYNYARWLTRDEGEAEDVVQDASVRAMRFFRSLRGTDARSWLLAIVRNTWYSRAAKRSTRAEDGFGDGNEPVDDGLDPEERLLQQDAVARVQSALERLPGEFREVILLREMEGLSYKEIAAVLGVPPGTVMSRLARARDRLLVALTHDADREGVR